MNEHLTQFCTAWALARAYWHGWAADYGTSFTDMVEDVHLAASAEEACERIRARYKALPSFPGQIAGIECPELAGDNIVHTTGTGRLSWVVRPDGSVSFTVSTPYGVVAQAEVSAPEVARTRYGEPYIRRTANMWARDARPRHVMALNKAISVLATIPECPDGDVLELARFLQSPFGECEGLRVEVDLDGSKSTMGPGVWFEGSWPTAASGVFVPLFTPFTQRDLGRAFAHLARTVDAEYASLARALGENVPDYMLFRPEPVSE